jgi:hypothetical protein
MKLEVSNDNTLFKMDVTSIAAKITADGVEIGTARWEEQEPQEILFPRTHTFTIDSAEITKDGSQKIAQSRTGPVSAVDYLNAVLSVRIVAKTFFREFLVTRDLPVRILINN